MIKKLLSISLVMFIALVIFRVTMSTYYEQDENKHKNYCKLIYKITSNFDHKETEPDQITINNKPLTSEWYPPGQYIIIIEKQGYHRKKLEIELLSSEETYILYEVLETKPRIVRSLARIHFPSSGSAPDVFLNGKNIYNCAFAPGKYQMAIQSPGYKTIEKEIIIEPGEDTYFIGFCLLEPEPREIRIDLRYDISPEKSNNYKITLTRPNEIVDIYSGCFILPNTYSLKIEQNDYETVEKMLCIDPAKTPYLIREMLHKKGN